MRTEHAITSAIVVKTTFEATHCWKNIPDNHPSYFLKFPHRHLFAIELMLKVSHDDRDVEFFDFKSKLDKTLREMFPKKVGELLPDLGSMSCEMLAERLLAVFEKQGCVIAKVFEDDENGSIAMFDMNTKLTGDLQVD